MDTQRSIDPRGITKPIQLLAAWLSGLIVLDGSFLLAASRVSEPSWVPAVLVVASIVNVPLFVFAIFLLQTRFRPEMQEDSFYSKYLESRTARTERTVTPDSVAALREDVARLEAVVAKSTQTALGGAELQKLKWSSVTVSLNKRLEHFERIARSLSERGIPIHETFGGGAGVPPEFSVVVGNGFDPEQVAALVDALLPVADGWISYAHDDDQSYDHQVLIGAYGDQKHGLRLAAMKALSPSRLSTLDLYKVLGR